MKKRILSLLLVLVMCIGILPFAPSVSASEAALEPENWQKEGDFYFVIYGGDAMVCSYVGNETRVVVPSSYKGRDVTDFNYDLLSDCPVKEDVTEIYFPSTICGYFKYEWHEDGSGYYFKSGFNLSAYNSLKTIEISGANPYFKDREGCVYSKNGKVLWYVPYNGGSITFSTSKYSGVTEVRNIRSKRIKYLTIGASVEKIYLDNIDCPNVKELYITTKTDNIVHDDMEYCNIKDGAVIYCYKSSGAYEYFKGSKIFSIVTEPKKPAKKTSIKSVKYSRCDPYDTDNYAVKITVKDVGASGYKIYRYNSSSKKYEYIGKTTDGSTTYVDRTAKPSKTYKYKAAAYNYSNKLYSANTSKSGVKSVKTTLTKPKKLSFTATFTNGGVKVNFEKISCSGYALYRYNSETKKYELVRRGDYGHFSVDGDITAVKGKTYTYKMRAYNKSSTGKIVYGPYSEKVKIKCK